MYEMHQLFLFKMLEQILNSIIRNINLNFSLLFDIQQLFLKLRSILSDGTIQKGHGPSATQNILGPILSSNLNDQMTTFDF